MKVLKFTIVVTIIATLVSCEKSVDKQSADKKGFIAIEKELKNQFGDEAYYTDLTITHNQSIGGIIRCNGY